jgi:hypothetical protein
MFIPVGTVKIFVAMAFLTKHLTANDWLVLQGLATCALAGAAIENMRMIAARRTAGR